MLEIGMSSAGAMPTEPFIRSLAEAGVRHLEISLSYDGSRVLNYEEIKRLATQYGVNIWSYHLPFGAPDVLDIASRDEAIRTKTVSYWCELIKKGAEIGIKRFVAHPSSEPKSKEPEERELELLQSMRSLQTLAEVAAEQEATIAVEDLPRSCLGRNSEELLRLISSDARLGICFDTNHLLREDLYEFAERIAHKIVTVHISDYDFINERHWLPGEGKIDWPRLYGILMKSGYHGAWMYELGAKFSKTITRDRDLTPADFVRNAEEIFSGAHPTPMGTPKENLGMWG